MKISITALISIFCSLLVVNSIQAEVTMDLIGNDLVIEYVPDPIPTDSNFNSITPDIYVRESNNGEVMVSASDGITVNGMSSDIMEFPLDDIIIYGQYSDVHVYYLNLTDLSDDLRIFNSNNVRLNNVHTYTNDHSSIYIESARIDIQYVTTRGDLNVKAKDPNTVYGSIIKDFKMRNTYIGREFWMNAGNSYHGIDSFGRHFALNGPGIWVELDNVGIGGDMWVRLTNKNDNMFIKTGINVGGTTHIDLSEKIDSLKIDVLSNRNSTLGEAFLIGSTGTDTVYQPDQHDVFFNDNNSSSIEWWK